MSQLVFPLCATVLQKLLCLQVISVPSNRWYEPREVLLGEEYFLHAFGSFYVVSGHSVDKWIVPNAHMLRKLSNEGILLLP